ncbi:hypothetical protein EHS86_16865 [Erwinia amylovora]|uniref:Uncharacterized protein n=1 Tax=Erwinia amylovora NBRC 12687 = CFBP 1232 TaxID=1219359 RepID=A0A831A7E8_ERWAM|nr:hypothetical protein AD997_02825 [Erwinia amylovora]RWS36938.1 hypothetical protein EHS86_16865 [Erwinia amylovora]GAJ90271.1 hypothetical protein EAM01S_23_00040 [Erwinia amylovora NBRC 12687 = CFBP 1232]CBJ45216.1 hypothetical protein EAM_0541 [Erwinia amylovora ATCC 49946]CCO95074.1 hypothetical protein BN437_3168 [Erwinia amylovora NBRC 12687 = CFBP 1232]
MVSDCLARVIIHKEAKILIFCETRYVSQSLMLANKVFLKVREYPDFSGAKQEVIMWFINVRSSLRIA